MRRYRPGGGGVKGRVLIVAGSDSGGGAGIQADIKTVTALGGYAATAISALTAQNTLGVDAVELVPAAFVVRQMELVLDDIGADAIKTGMLPTAQIIDAVCDVIETWAQPVPLVVDPVMVAKGGARLLDPAALDVMKRRLLFLADVITPNNSGTNIRILEKTSRNIPPINNIKFALRRRRCDESLSSLRGCATVAVMPETVSK